MNGTIMNVLNELNTNQLNVFIYYYIKGKTAIRIAKSHWWS